MSFRKLLRWIPSAFPLLLTAPVALAQTPLGDAAQLAAAVAGDHTCIVTTGGGVKCWGSNDKGQLGDGTTTTRAYPVDVPSLASGVVAVATGQSHSCALTTGGAVKCWGGNGLGQLGNGSNTPLAGPTDVTGLSSGMAAISAGRDFTCALTTGGGVKCWGANSSFQLGAGNPFLGKEATPVDVTDLSSGVSAITTGGTHTCALLSSGGVKCWGDNRTGQLGLGDTSIYRGPSDVPGFAAGTLAVSAGNGNTCAVTTGGGVKCWGTNQSGEVGDGTTTSPRTSPTDVSGLGSGVSGVAAGSFSACAWLVSGGAKCWGQNSSSKLGDGTANDSAVPVDVASPGAAVQSLALGASHTCALLAGGGVKCWGANSRYQGGNGQAAVQATPVAVLVGDSVPDAFGFAAQAPVPLASTRTSNAVTPMGFASPALLTVANGEHSIGCTATFVTTPAIFDPGQSLCLRHVSSSSRSTAVTTTVTIGGVDGAFTSTTAAQGTLTTIAAPATSLLGDAVTFTATVAPGSPGGTVDFFDGATPIAGCAGVPLSAGQATCVTALAGGNHAITAAYSGGGGDDASTSAPFAHLVTEPGRLVNISTRANIASGENVLIAGFIIGGTVPKTVVVRSRGPSLGSQGVVSPLADPQLALYSGQSIIASNDDWQSAANAAQVQASGFAPLSATESAILTTLAPGAYTAIVTGANQSAGTAIVEVFEVDGPLSPFANISTRAQVLTGQGVVIGGFAVQGNQPKSFVIRARGPSLAQQGVGGVLQNPVLELYDLRGTLIASNDDWGSAANAAQLQASGFAPASASEAALLITLQPGLYTAIVTGAAGTTGVAIVEVFAQ